MIQNLSLYVFVLMITFALGLGLIANAHMLCEDDLKGKGDGFVQSDGKGGIRVVSTGSCTLPLGVSNDVMTVHSGPEYPETTEVAPLVFRTEDRWSTETSFGIPPESWYTVDRGYYFTDRFYLRANSRRIHYDLDILKHVRRADHD